MNTSTNIQEEIQQQINIGFGKDDIVQNLRSKGYNTQEINDAIANINFSSVVTESNGGSVSGKSILIGVLFLVIALARFARNSNGGSNSNIFIGLGVFSAIGMAIYFFTKKK